MKRLLLIFGLAACMLLPLQGMFIAKGYCGPTAKQTLLTAIDEVIDILNTGDYSDPAKKDALIEKINPVMHRIFDFKEMSMRTVGRPWRSFSKQQQTEFAELFAKLLTETYIDRLQGYSGEKVQYTGERTSKRGNVEVQTTVVSNGKQIPIDYRLTEKDSWVVYDVLVESVSMVKNYRSQFHEILVNGTPEELLGTLREKVASMRKKSN